MDTEVEILEITDQPDGSCIVEMVISRDMLLVFAERGFNSILREYSERVLGKNSSEE